MANEVAGIDIVARLDAFRAELGKIPDIGGKEAKALAGQLEREIRKATKAAQDAAKASRDTRREVTAMSDRFGAAGSSAAKLAGALSLVSPGAAEAARSVADLADVGEVGAAATTALGVSMGVAAAAVAAVSAAATVGYGVWTLYTAEVRAADAAATRLATTLAAVAPASERVADARLAADRATGLITDAEYAYQKALQTAASARDADIKKAREAHGVTEDQVAAVQLLLDGTGQYSQALATADQSAVQAAVAIGAINTGYDEQVGHLQRARDATEGARRATEGKAAADRQAADAAAQAAASFALLLDVEASEQAQVERVTGAVAELVAAADASARSRLSGEELLQERLAGTVAGYGQVAASALLAATTEEQRQAIITAREAAIAEATATTQQQLDELRARSHEEQLRQIEEVTRAAEAQASALRDLAVTAVGQGFATIQTLGAAAADQYAATAAALREQLEDTESELTGRQRAELEKRAAAHEKAAVTAFNVQKGASAGIALIEGLEASVKAYSAALELGPPGLVLAPIVAGAAAGFAIAQAGAIAAQPAPTFHSGLAPDEIPAVLTTKEGVLTQQGVRTAGGSDAIRELNSGHKPTSAPSYLVLDHRVMGEAMVRQLQRGPVAAAVRAGDRVGHRSR